MDDSIIRKFKGVIPDNITLRTDNGPQYISKEFNSYPKTNGINHEYIERETHEENGDIESFHNSIKTDYIWINVILSGITPLNFLIIESSIAFIASLAVHDVL